MISFRPKNMVFLLKIKRGADCYVREAKVAMISRSDTSKAPQANVLQATMGVDGSGNRFSGPQMRTVMLGRSQSTASTSIASANTDKSVIITAETFARLMMTIRGHASTIYSSSNFSSGEFTCVSPMPSKQIQTGPTKDQPRLTYCPSDVRRSRR